MGDVEREDSKVIVQGGCAQNNVKIRNRLSAFPQPSANFGNAFRYGVVEGDNWVGSKKGPQRSYVRRWIVGVKRSLIHLRNGGPAEIYRAGPEVL